MIRVCIESVMIPSGMMYFLRFSIIFHLWKTVGCQNAILTAVPTNVAPGDSITLICDYKGARNVSIVSWFNGSTLDVLMLKPGSIVPECDVFATITASYDLRRISYTCDVVRKRYTITITSLGPMDENVKWSCTLQDPQPPPGKAEYTIHLTASTRLTGLTKTMKTLTPAIRGNKLNAAVTMPYAQIIVIGVAFITIVITYC